jgi:3-hydroxybutyryl-CoA dehydrogenase
MQAETLDSLVAKQATTEPAASADKLVIIGGGIMGQGIAQVAAKRGLDVLLLEIDEEALQHALDGIAETLDREIEKWALTESEKKGILSRIKGSVNYTDITDQIYLIEAVPERLDLKQALFRELELHCVPEAILITNTSTLSITELAAAMARPERVIGMHFLSPVPKVKVVELVRGVHTTNLTFQKALVLAEKLERTAIEVFESPGYVTTRVIVPMINEAVQVLMEGVASAEDIDTALRLGYELNVGPLSMADRMGLDTLQSWLDTLFRDLGDQKYRPCPLLRMMVRAGLLGAKTGQGFFRYDEEGRAEPGSGLTTAALDRFLSVRKER